VHNLGLLFDVDGPLASPTTRTVAIDSILTDLVALTGAGVPIAFITGRSDEFIRTRLAAPLVEVGLAGALAADGARLFGVFEKGGSWAPITADGMADVTVDRSVALPTKTVDAVRERVRRDFADTMFFDETKKAMISVEQRTDVTHEVYLAAQPVFNDAAFALLKSHGLGTRYGDEEALDASGQVPFRLDPTIISTDIESVKLDKDRGARRALEYFASLGQLPRRWRSIGDSRSDYLMADYLHAQGFEVGRVDGRASDGVLDRPYQGIVIADAIHDDAGAEFLAHWTHELRLDV
jgi:hypothetical protein